MTDTDALDRAADALAAGDLVVYPTETVYGLGADALDPAAVERVFETKGRDRSNPISLAVPSVDAALEYTNPTARERRFMHEFLPGPVTVVVDRREMVPEVLTAGSDRVGVRVPDHDLALALLERFAPITATSANLSGTGSVRHPDALSDEIREAVAVVLDGSEVQSTSGNRTPSGDGETPGGGSTVVDVAAGEIVREGALADEIRDWLAAE